MRAQIKAGLLRPGLYLWVCLVRQVDAEASKDSGANEVLRYPEVVAGHLLRSFSLQWDSLVTQHAAEASKDGGAKEVPRDPQVVLGHCVHLLPLGLLWSL
jgi:hypothetical protein